MSSDITVPPTGSTPTDPAEGKAVVKTRSGSPHLAYLDGVRGLAALYVVLYHASDPSWAAGPLPGKLLTFLKFLSFGHFSVAVFIVLSGYCLMMPVAQTSDLTLRGGFWGYIKRRARRILPPYYAALAVCLLLIALVPVLKTPSHTQSDESLPAFTASAIIPHLLVIHNLSPAWIWKIDGPLWSVATEWQIYFAFPVLILVARTRGLFAALLLAVVAGEAPHFAHLSAIEGAAPWYLGLFALGMTAATINFGTSAGHTRLRVAVPWAAVTLVLWLATAIGAFRFSHPWWANLWASDILVGAATASLLLWLTEGAKLTDVALRGPVRARMLKFTGAPFAVGIGAFSYSLYLMHDPIMVIVWSFMRGGSFSPVTRMALMLTVAIVVSFAVTYGFHLIFEKPFMKKAAPRRSKTTPANA